MPRIARVSNQTGFSTEQIRRVVDHVMAKGDELFPGGFDRVIPWELKILRRSDHVDTSFVQLVGQAEGATIRLFVFDEANTLHVSVLLTQCAHALFGASNPLWIDYVSTFEDPIALACLWEKLQLPRSGFIRRRRRKNRPKKKSRA